MMTMSMVNPDQFPHAILRGEVAGLSVLRSVVTGDNSNNSSNSRVQYGAADKSATTEEGRTTTSSLLQTFFDERGGEPLLATPMNVTVSCNDSSASSSDEGDGDNDDDRDCGKDSQYVNDDDDDEQKADGDNNDNETADATSEFEKNNTKSTVLRGHIFISSSQLLFVAASVPASKGSTSSSIDNGDIAIGATCITLHAMMDDPEPAVYLQLSDGDDEDDEDEGGVGPLELTITPTEDDRADNCQKLFDRICQLVSQWPVNVDDDDDNGGNNIFGSGIGAGFGALGIGFDGEGGWMTAHGLVDGDGNDDGGNDDLVWAEPDNDEDADADDGATQEERDAMLERLDNLLVVPQEMEIEGQFDDAE